MHEEVQRRELLRAADEGRAGAAFARGNSEKPEADRQEGRTGGDFGGALAADAVATGDVAGLVRDHALDLVRRVGSDNEAGMDMDVLAVRHEGVQAGIIDDVEADITGVEARDGQDLVSPLAQGFLDFGVTD